MRPGPGRRIWDRVASAGTSLQAGGRGAGTIPVPVTQSPCQEEGWLRQDVRTHGRREDVPCGIWTSSWMDSDSRSEHSSCITVCTLQKNLSFPVKFTAQGRGTWHASLAEPPSTDLPAQGCVCKAALPFIYSPKRISQPKDVATPLQHPPAGAGSLPRGCPCSEKGSTESNVPPVRTWHAAGCQTSCQQRC